MLVCSYSKDKEKEQVKASNSNTKYDVAHSDSH